MSGGERSGGERGRREEIGALGWIRWFGQSCVSEELQLPLHVTLVR